MADTRGSRRIFGLGSGAGGWVFDILVGLVLANLVVAIPLGVLAWYLGNPAHLLTLASVGAGVCGVVFMRRARGQTGPAWFRY
jgi:hypothetical protein